MIRPPCREAGRLNFFELKLFYKLHKNSQLSKNYIHLKFIEMIKTKLLQDASYYFQ